MDETSTPIDVSPMNRKEEVKNKGPKNSTLEFIKQFARVYSYEPKLKNNLGEFIAN